MAFLALASRESWVLLSFGSTCSEAVALYKLGEVPLLDAGGSHLVDDADGEDGEVVYLHCLVLEHELLHTAHHIGEKAFDGTLRERVLWLAMCSASSSIPMVSVTTGRA